MCQSKHQMEIKETAKALACHMLYTPAAKTIGLLSVFLLVIDYYLSYRYSYIYIYILFVNL